MLTRQPTRPKSTGCSSHDPPAQSASCGCCTHCLKVALAAQHPGSPRTQLRPWYSLPTDTAHHPCRRKCCGSEMASGESSKSFSGCRWRQGGWIGESARQQILRFHPRAPSSECRHAYTFGIQICLIRIALDHNSQLTQLRPTSSHLINSDTASSRDRACPTNRQ